MKQQTVILAITYDETLSAPPSKWDWPALLEVAPEHVECVLTGVLVTKEE